MQINTPYKLLDLVTSDELMNFDFDALTANFSPPMKMRKKDNTDIGLSSEFDDLQLIRILDLHPMHWAEPRAHASSTFNRDKPIFQLIINEVAKLEELYDATAKIAVLDGLAPGSKIKRHFDKGSVFDNCHRVHLPLVTDQQVDFYIDDVKYHFKKGQFFEFNNKMYHEVHNNSDVFRIHLVVDLLPNV